MTKFKWVGLNNSICFDLIMLKIRKQDEPLMTGDIIDIPDTEKNKVFIERIKAPIEPNFELVGKTTKKQTKTTKEDD